MGHPLDGLIQARHQHLQEAAETRAVIGPLQGVPCSGIAGPGERGRLRKGPRQGRAADWLIVGQ